MSFKSLLSFTFVLASTFSYAASLRVGGFNVEAIDANPQVIAKQIASNPKIEIWGLAESQKIFADAIVFALNKQEQQFDAILGTTGNKQRLQIIYNKRRFTLQDTCELHNININGRVRAPLVALFYDKQSGKSFYFMVNHLYRGSRAGRYKQSEMLRDWAMRQAFPVIGVGDYNYDLSPNDWRQHDKGFDLMTEGNVFKWVRPSQLLSTQCSHYKSILDFVFVSGAAQNWAQSSTILNPEEDYCPDTAMTSDHRPIKAEFEL